ncbi:acyltransferase family protein [Gallibacterium anatis]|uniref:acyltransferase family protein n=1 Tax=Gallibacterium anatis TaxID=750 RepID=UPI003D7B14CE
MTEDYNLRNFSILKAIMMILIVFYHSIALWLPEGWFILKPTSKNLVFSILAQWLNLFHIYVFTFISGYIFNYLKINTIKYNNFIHLLIKKVKRLIIPYFFVSFFWCIPFYIYFYSPSVEQVILNYILGYRPSQLWYLLMLFWCFIFVNPIFEFIRRFRLMIILFFSLTLYCTSVILSVLCSLPFQIIPAIKFMSFFILGFFYSDINFLLRKLYMDKWYFLLLINILFFSLYLKIDGGYFIMKFIKYIICYFIILSGIFFATNFFNAVCQISFWRSKIFNIFMKHSFSIYLFHQQVIWCIIYYYNFNFPKFNDIFLIIFCFLISSFVPILISIVMYRFKFTKSMIGG